MTRVWRAQVQCLDGILVIPAPGAWCLDTKHARRTSRSEEPGLVTASLPKGKDIHVGSYLCKIRLIGSPGGNVVIMHHDFVLTELGASSAFRDDSAGSVVPRVSLISYMKDASQELLGSRMNWEWKDGFQLRLICTLSCTRGRKIGFPSGEKSNCLFQPD